MLFGHFFHIKSLRITLELSCPSLRSPCTIQHDIYEILAQYLQICGQGKRSNFTTVNKAKRQKFGPHAEFLGQNLKLFSRKKCTKIALKFFVGMPNSRLSTNFQLNIFIFVARVSFQTLLQSLKQKDRKSAHMRNIPKSLPLQVIKYYMSYLRSLY